MKAVILAGGFGTRISEESGIRPKPMVEIGGRPIMWHIMMHYSHYNFRDFVIALGYKGEYIQKYKSDTAKLAPILKGKSLEETLRNNWNFVYNHIQYKLDTPGIEELRRPARTWAERKSRWKPSSRMTKPRGMSP